jgi:cobalt-zinc-cadmium resistance protein CzcA
MRFNELITGVRADIAIKIFGEDLAVLSALGNEIKSTIAEVEGAADITVEKIVGLPQMSVKYQRHKIARYGLNIEQVNNMVAMGFAGKKAGVVYEGEKRFDLVVRLRPEKRSQIEDLNNLYIDLPEGGKVPLSELAEITYQKGAAKISRDDTKRRIVVGVNVRNRDLQSVVDDIQQLISENISLPVGYTIDYGGQFQNLKMARKRLLIAVPIALLLIFIMLYLAFKSFKLALVIFTAIPLAAVGGVLLLWMRGLPFSISAGIGFIALFGIAVLNGIVLIEHFKELQNQKFENMQVRIIQGTKDRMRAVLLTATAAALGFLPMAISTNVGAEVQRPLATVVIGGLITATLLTLIVLPLLYSIVAKPFKININKNWPFFKVLSTFIILLLSSQIINAQDNAKSLENLTNMAIINNAGLKANALKVEESKALIPSAFSFEKTEFYYAYDQNNLAINNEPLNVFGIQQDFLFPTVYFSKKRLNKARMAVDSSQYEVRVKALKKEVASRYYNYIYVKEIESIYLQLDSLFVDFANKAERRFELGATNYLEKITAQSKQRQLKIKLEQARQDVEIAYGELRTIIQNKDSIVLAKATFSKIQLRPIEINEMPEFTYLSNYLSLSEYGNKYEKQQLLPDISLSYFQGSNPTLNQNLFGYHLGLKIPLFFSGQKSRIKSSTLAYDAAIQDSIQYNIQFQTKLTTLKSKLLKFQKALDYYEKDGTILSDEILNTANLSFKNGEIDFFQYLLSIQNAYEIKLDYLDNLNRYNQTVIALNHITL